MTFFTKILILAVCAMVIECMIPMGGMGHGMMGGMGHMGGMGGMGYMGGMGGMGHMGGMGGMGHMGGMGGMGMYPGMGMMGFKEEDSSKAPVADAAEGKNPTAAEITQAFADMAEQIRRKDPAPPAEDH